MSRCLLRGAAPWLAAGVLVAPGLSGMALASGQATEAERTVDAPAPRADPPASRATPGRQATARPTWEETGASRDASARPPATRTAAGGQTPARPTQEGSDASAQPPATRTTSGGPGSREVPEGRETRTRREEPARGTAEQDEEAAHQDPEEDTPSPRPWRPMKGCAPDARFAGLWPAVKDVKFHPTTLEERAAFAKLLPALLKAAQEGRTLPAGLEKLAASVGFRLEVWDGKQDTFWVLREPPGKLRGAGAYVVRTGPATDDIIQVPHPWFDRGTEDIGVGLFTCAPEGQRPRLFMTATAHRYHGNPGETPEDPEHPADVAHNPDHLFQEVTNQVARTLAAPRVVQLHGFGTAKAEAGLRDKSLVAVVSSGTRQPTPWARQVSKRLAKVLGEGVRLYPEGAQVLGGTQNAQGRLLQSYECARFLHLELSARARKSLSSGERLARVGRVLFAPLED
ncbi:hypothetical protein HPC49_05390 [Pyxidicoccus fallax]|uniref:Uncharacterized protein n=1 Tax=Pyxidicoccus fallax TaxID=394095 RepID=A0A848L836_9BACT|nr:hypothetical protein [Pyxidicoccus fallax]NMO14726.1 hypothetical protein [Pyxidicoccus fallax]NPC77687.1 hypothetical protein [Pyxidicoccus fallax]